MLCPEDIQRKNVIKTEKLLINNHGELPKTMIQHFDKIKENLNKYEVGDRLLNRISDTMYKATLMKTLEEAETDIKYLADTFWDQIY
ncbi:hypothetical protein [Sporosarcina sp. FSL W7-1283]|uniref:hypothetical protein n=1 Tax=Sporosarcina sp. FSL W7-1283 TaxID=2921560 RepID=UPI0030F7EBAB